MSQCIAALLTPAWTLLQALFAPPRGRHSARRRRSRRVRPYLPELPPATRPSVLPAHPTLRAPIPQPRHKSSARSGRLAPPSTTPRAEEVALVRPYLSAHESDLAQQRATQRLRAWGALPPPTTTPRPHTGTRSEPRPPVQDWGTDFPLPQPRIPTPRVPSRLEELPHLSRLRHRQQQRRTQAAAV